jgi:hypothetical protein
MFLCINQTYMYAPTVLLSVSLEVCWVGKLNRFIDVWWNIMPYMSTINWKGSMHKRVNNSHLFCPPLRFLSTMHQCNMHNYSYSLPWDHCRCHRSKPALQCRKSRQSSPDRCSVRSVKTSFAASPISVQYRWHNINHGMAEQFVHVSN